MGDGGGAATSTVPVGGVGKLGGATGGLGAGFRTGDLLSRGFGSAGDNTRAQRLGLTLALAWFVTLAGLMSLAGLMTLPRLVTLTGFLALFAASLVSGFRLALARFLAHRARLVRV